MKIAFQCASSMIKITEFKKINININYRYKNLNRTKYTEKKIFKTIQKITGEMKKNHKYHKRGTIKKNFSTH